MNVADAGTASYFFSHYEDEGHQKQGYLDTHQKCSAAIHPDFILLIIIIFNSNFLLKK